MSSYGFSVGCLSVDNLIYIMSLQVIPLQKVIFSAFEDRSNFTEQTEPIFKGYRGFLFFIFVFFNFF